MPRVGLFVALVAFLALAAPSAASAQSFVTDTLGGTGVSAQGPADLTVLDVPTQMTLLVQGNEVNLRVIDEVTRAVTKYPLDPSAPFPGVAMGRPERKVADTDLTAFGLQLESVLDAVIIVSHVNNLQVETAATFTITTVQDHVVEASHAVRSDTWIGGELPFEYYEYRSGDALELTTDGGNVIATGDFDLYFWGATFSYDSAGESGRVRTGAWHEANETYQQSWIVDEHLQYALLSVRGGSLQAQVVDGKIRQFTPETKAEPVEAVFVGARGSLPVPDGRFDSSGDAVSVSGGSYNLRIEGPGIGVDVLRRPSAASGTNSVFVPSVAPWDATPWVWASVIILGIALVAALGTYPNVRGAMHLRRLGAMSLRAPTGTWRQQRAEGYAAMAAAAEAAGHPRRAAFWMVRALRVWPTDPLRMVDAAILLAQAGNLRRALRQHELAHGWLVEAGSADHVAHNAFEAARAAARVGRGVLALDWLRIALEADPGQASRIGKDPAFAGLRGEPDYASLTMGES